MPSGDMSISLVVSSRNRADGLSVCLDAVAQAAQRADGLDLELVFVDNGSTDATPQIVEAFAATAPLSVRLLREPRPGLSVARNTGLAAARGNLLAFTDDDCALAPEYFTRVAAAFRNDAEPILRGGRVELGDARDLPVTIKTDAEPARLDRTLHPGGFVHGCNMAFPRTIPERIGGFDERFGAGARFRSGEDTDYIHRVFKAGMGVAYEPAMLVHHFHGRRRPEDVHRLHAGYAFGNGALYAKYMFDRGSNMRGMLRWDLRMAARELFTGQTLSPGLGLTWRATVRDSLSGMMSYWLNRPQAG
ncbi:glycosyltransferase family 2 protein [Aureimonas frigidaquae]|uniref:Glycosyl transferase family 2 n=1 Tax=Aureimonas frigidaquae TaxID=424757 RepID=A0A0P0Z0C7_9HYPH|nr:glycosyltransferase family A protein [Aureimonas frigidaquae]BAT27343.1 glycosyl transferase family 2 [Aureimonas frigidaquae]